MKSEQKTNLFLFLASCRTGSNGEERFKILQDIKKEIVDDDKNEFLNNYCNALGNKTRLNILRILKKEEYCVCELEVILGKSQSTISHHLRILEEINLIRGWKKGKFTFYVFNKELFKQGLELMKKSFPD